VGKTEGGERLTGGKKPKKSKIKKDVKSTPFCRKSGGRGQKLKIGEGRTGNKRKAV